MKALEKLYREAIREQVSRFDMAPLFREYVEQMQLTVPARVACRMMGIGIKAFRKLGLPIVNLSDKTWHYRVEDIKAEIEKRRQK